jgi:uncharacterized repeat protein (TIGR01451 family)
MNKHVLLFFCSLLPFFGIAQADLSVTSSTLTPTLTAFNNLTVTVVVTNSGPQTATNFKLLAAPGQLSGQAVFQGGNEGTVTTGSILNQNTWLVPSLASGQSATWTINLFTLTGTEIKVFCSVIEQTQSDPDSSPSNATGFTPVEDDETVVIINGTTTVLQPNLKPMSSTLAATATSGTNMSQTLIVKNIGTAAASASTVKAYLSTDNTFSPSTDILLTQNSFTALAVNAQLSKTFSVPIPAGIAGTRFVLFRADADDAIVESNETDNILAKQVFFSAGTPKPDLIVVSTVTSPASIAVTESLPISLQVKNQGTAVSNTSAVYVYMSTNTTISADDFLLGEMAIPVLSNGATSAVVTTTFNNVPNNPGTWYLIFKADGANTVSESNETNNIVTKSLNLTGSQPELYFLETAPYVNVPSWTYFEINSTVVNGGTGTATNIVNKTFLSFDNALDASDALVLTSPAISEITPGNYSNSAFAANVPVAYQNGNFYLFHKTDADNLIAETNENNNTLSGYFACNWFSNPVNFAFSSSVDPAQLSPGDSVYLQHQLYNNGNWYINPAQSVTVQYYYSNDAVYQATDQLLVTKTYTGLTNFYEGSVNSGGFNIPATAPAGTRYVIVKVDTNNQYVESSETDNTVAYPFTSVTTAVPDLKAVSISTPASVPYGVAFNVTATIKNTGTAASAATTMVLAFTFEPFYSYSTLATINVPALPAGQTTSITQSITIPNQNADSLYLGGVIATVSGELSLLDNTIWKKTDMYDLAPDLEVSNFTLANGATPGTIQVMATIKNIGLTNMTPTVAELSYMPNLGNQTINREYVNPGQFQVPALVAGQTHTINQTLTMSEEFLSGSLKFQLRVNPNSVTFDEVSFNNNYADYTLTNYVAPTITHTYFDQGAGLVGTDIRRLANGNFQVIARNGAGGFKIITTSSAGLQLSTFDTQGDSSAVFGNEGKILGLSRADANKIRLRLYNENGTIQWANTYTSPNGIPFYSDVNNFSGAATATGTGYAIVINVTVNTSSPSLNDVWALSVNESGAVNWTNVDNIPYANGDQYKAATNITVTPNGNLRVAGFLSGSSFISSLFTSLYNPTTGQQLLDSVLAGNSSFYFSQSLGKMKPGLTGNEAILAYNTINSQSISQYYLGTAAIFRDSIAFSGAYAYNSVIPPTPWNASANFSSSAWLNSGSSLHTGSWNIGDNTLATWFRCDINNSYAKRFRGPGRMIDIYKVNNNLYACTGARNGQATIVFVDSIGHNTAPPTDGGPGNAYDLAMTATVSNTAPAIYTHVTFTFTVTNQGTQSMSNIVASIPKPTNIAYTSHTATAGTTYDAWNGIWTIGTLAAGQSKTVSIVLFTLNTNPNTVWGQITACSNTDADSQPNNGTAPLVNQDDEAKATIYGTGLTYTPSNSLVISDFYPNPCSGVFFLDFQSPIDQPVSLTLSDAFGRPTQQENYDLSEGRQTIQFDLKDQPSGMYLLQIQTADGRIASKWLSMTID